MRIPMLHLVALIVAAVLCVTVKVNAQAPPGDVPRIAEDEIARRGSHVEQTGTIRSGAAAAALAPPADDSEKWFLTLVVKNNDPGSERMRTVLAKDPALQAWQSLTHYQVRSIDDRTQADWLEALRPAIARGVPIVVVQPPKSGRFGPSSTVVAMIPGVHSGPDLSNRLRDAILRYANALEQQGISQPAAGPSAPFSKDDRPVDWVPHQIPPDEHPSEPAQGSPNLWPALMAFGMAFGSFLAGWLSARLKTLAGARIAELNRALAALKAVPRDPT